MHGHGGTPPRPSCEWDVAIPAPGPSGMRFPREHPARGARAAAGGLQPAAARDGCRSSGPRAHPSAWPEGDADLRATSLPRLVTRRGEGRKGGRRRHTSPTRAVTWRPSAWQVMPIRRCRRCPATGDVGRAHPVPPGCRASSPAPLAGGRRTRPRGPKGPGLAHPPASMRHPAPWRTRGGSANRQARLPDQEVAQASIPEERALDVVPRQHVPLFVGNAKRPRPPRQACGASSGGSGVSARPAED